MLLKCESCGANCSHTIIQLSVIGKYIIPEDPDPDIEITWECYDCGVIHHFYPEVKIDEFRKRFCNNKNYKTIVHNNEINIKQWMDQVDREYDRNKIKENVLELDNFKFPEEYVENKWQKERKKKRKKDKDSKKNKKELKELKRKTKNK